MVAVGFNLLKMMLLKHFGLDLIKQRRVESINL